MKKALTAVLIVLLALFMVACDSNPNDEQTPPPEEKTFTPDWVKRGDYTGYVVIREKITEELYEFVDATFTVDDDYILFTVMINGNELEFRADANNVNEKDVTVTTDSWTMKVTDLDYPDGSEGKTNATVVVKNNEDGNPVMTIDFEAAPYNNYIYYFEYEEPVIEPTFAPDWAVGEYVCNHDNFGEMKASIRSDAFGINMTVTLGPQLSFPVNISYPDDTGKVKVDSNSNMDNPGVSPWKITLSGITIAGKDPVKVTIENVIANKELKISVELGGDLSSINEKLGNMLFSTDNSSAVTE